MPFKHLTLFFDLPSTKFLSIVSSTYFKISSVVNYGNAHKTIGVDTLYSIELDIYGDDFFNFYLFYL